MDTIEQIIRRIIREELAELVDSLQPAPPPRSSAVGDGLIWLTVAEIAKRTNRHEQTVRRACVLQELHGTQGSKGAWWRAHTDCVDAWAERRPCPHRKPTSPRKRGVSEVTQ